MNDSGIFPLGPGRPGSFFSVQKYALILFPLVASDPEQVAESLRLFILVVVIVAGVQTDEVQMSECM